jgi:hypothetical protein
METTKTTRVQDCAVAVHFIGNLLHNGCYVLLLLAEGTYAFFINEHGGYSIL